MPDIECPVTDALLFLRSRPIMYLQASGKAEYRRKEKTLMLDKENSAKLKNAVMERIHQKYPITDGTEKLISVISQIAADTTIITLQEYEKMNQKKDSND